MREPQKAFVLASKMWGSESITKVSGYFLSFSSKNCLKPSVIWSISFEVIRIPRTYISPCYVIPLIRKKWLWRNFGEYTESIKMTVLTHFSYFLIISSETKRALYIWISSIKESLSSLVYSLMNSFTNSIFSLLCCKSKRWLKWWKRAGTSYSRPNLYLSLPKTSIGAILHPLPVTKSSIKLIVSLDIIVVSGSWLWSFYISFKDHSSPRSFSKYSLTRHGLCVVT